MKKTLLMIVTVFMVLVLSACGIITQSTPSQTTSAPTTQPTQKIAAPTIQPTSAQVTEVPTVPPKPVISLSLAVLGGSIHAFDQKFGSNNCCYRNGWTLPNGPYVAVEDDTYNRESGHLTFLHI
jgi:ABC-type Fe3+-hydroxamate transport system substrate-binding protein